VPNGSAAPQKADPLAGGLCFRVGPTRDSRTATYGTTIRSPRRRAAGTNPGIVSPITLAGDRALMLACDSPARTPISPGAAAPLARKIKTSTPLSK